MLCAYVTIVTVTLMRCFLMSCLCCLRRRWAHLFSVAMKWLNTFFSSYQLSTYPASKWPWSLSCSYVVMRGLMFLHCLFFFFLVSFFSETRQWTKTKIWGRMTLTWKEVRPNFSEICLAVLEEGTFFYIYNQRLDESAIMDQDYQTYGAGRHHTGSCHKFLVLLIIKGD